MEQATGSQAHAAQWPAKRPLSPSARPPVRSLACSPAMCLVQNWGVHAADDVVQRAAAQKINHHRAAFAFCFQLT
jgi:hypothetical protein